MTTKNHEVAERAYRRGVHQAFAMLNDLSKSLRDDQLRTALDAAEDAACDLRHGALENRDSLMDEILGRVQAVMSEPWNQ